MMVDNAASWRRRALLAVPTLVAAVLAVGMYLQHEQIRDLQGETRQLDTRVSEVSVLGIELSTDIDELERTVQEVATVALQARQQDSQLDDNLMRGEVQSAHARVDALQACVNRVIRALNNRAAGVPVAPVTPC